MKRMARTGALNPEIKESGLTRERLLIFDMTWFANRFPARTFAKADAVEGKIPVHPERMDNAVVAQSTPLIRTLKGPQEKHDHQPGLRRLDAAVALVTHFPFDSPPGRAHATVV